MVGHVIHPNVALAMPRQCFHDVLPPMPESTRSHGDTNRPPELVLTDQLVTRGGTRRNGRLRVGGENGPNCIADLRTTPTGSFLNAFYEDGRFRRGQRLAVGGSEGYASHEAGAHGFRMVRGESVEEVFAWSAPAGRAVFDPE